MNEMKVKAIAPWFGGKRTLAPKIVVELGKHTQYFEPFCGSAAVLFAKEPSQKETASDLHTDLINLARVLANEPQAHALYSRTQSALYSEDLLWKAQYELDKPFDLIDFDAGIVDRAFWFFLASWQARNGTSGTERIDYRIAVRWTAGGGSPTVRWRNVTESIPAWHNRLKNVVILKRDAFKIVDRLEDTEKTCVYVDPPYPAETRSKGAAKGGAGSRYLHEFKHGGSSLLDPNADDHYRLAQILRGYRKARIVVSSYDCPRIRELYDGWTFVDHTMNKQLHAQNGRGARKKKAPEVLIINGPSYAAVKSCPEPKSWTKGKKNHD